MDDAEDSEVDGKANRDEEEGAQSTIPSSASTFVLQLTQARCKLTQDALAEANQMLQEKGLPPVEVDNDKMRADEILSEVGERMIDDVVAEFIEEAQSEAQTQAGSMAISKDHRASVECMHWEESGWDWQNLKDQPNATEAGQIIVDQFAHPENYPGIAKPPDSLLLVGPPATGKGTFAKIIISQAACRGFKVDSIFTAGSPCNWDALLKIANEERSIVYLDEVDSIFTTAAKARTLNVQRLWEGLDSFPNVLILAATNHPEKLPAAMQSRFSNRVVFNPLSADGLRNIFEDALKDNPLELSDEDWSKLRPHFKGLDARAVQEWARQVATLVARKCSLAKSELRKIKFEDCVAAKPELPSYSSGASTSGAIKAAVEATISPKDKATVVEVIKGLSLNPSTKVVALRSRPRAKGQAHASRSLMDQLSRESLLLLGAEDDDHKIEQAWNPKSQEAKMPWLAVLVANLKSCLIDPDGAFPGHSIQNNKTGRLVHSEVFTGEYVEVPVVLQE